MRKNWQRTAMVVLSLAICVFIYAVYRPKGTAIYRIIDVVSFHSFEVFRDYVREHISLHEALVYSVPGGLWVFSATLVARDLRLHLFKRSIPLEWLPMGFALWLECWQFFGVISGRFDWMDILFVVIFSALARIFSSKYEFPTQNVLAPFNTRSLEFATVFLSVFMAHVF